MNRNLQLWIFFRILIIIASITSFSFTIYSIATKPVLLILVLLMFISYYIYTLIRGKLIVKLLSLIGFLGLIITVIDTIISLTISSTSFAVNVIGNTITHKHYPFFGVLIIITIILECYFKRNEFLNINKNFSIEEKENFNSKEINKHIDKTKDKINNIQIQEIKKKIIERKKPVVIIFSILVLVIVFSKLIFGVGGYIYENYIGFETFDVAANTLIMYNKNEYESIPKVVGNWQSSVYSENGYYDDLKEEIVQEYGYSQEEVESMNFANYDTETQTKLNNIGLTYELSTNNAVENGQTIEITASFDEEMAKANKIEIVNNVFEVQIQGMKEIISPDEIQGKYSENDEYNQAVENRSTFYTNDSYTNQQISLEGIYLENEKDYDSNIYNQKLKYIYKVTADYERNNGKVDEKSEYCTISRDIYKQNDKYIVEDDADNYGNCSPYYDSVEDVITDEDIKIN